MSDFNCEVVRVRDVQKHPDADTLMMATANGNPVIFRTGDYQEGDLAAYVPVDAICPFNERFAFLGKNTRIKAKRMRGIFSMGLLTPIEPGWEEGQNVQEALGITKYEPHEDGPSGTRGPGGPSIPDPNNDVPPSAQMPVYDLESLRKYKRLLVPGEAVHISEKLHGQSARIYMDPERGLMVSSRRWWKKLDSACAWASYARANAELLSFIPPGVCLYGELYGNTELKYDATAAAHRFRGFDVYDPAEGRFWDYPQAAELYRALDIEMVPTLYEGEWSESLMVLAEGTSTLAGHVREGFVVQPVRERIEPHFGRVKLKMVGEGYLTRKGA
jgi:RNA ligase (TIGR02306 family)